MFLKVTLITHTPDPEKTIATAAKLCYSPCDIDTISDDLTPEKIESFVTMLASIGHESVMEHVSFTFGIEGISRACSHQLVRHRIASYSQKSQRYVNEDGFEFITPPEIAADAEAKAEFDRSMAALTESYSKIASILTEKHTKTFMEQGMEEKEARSKAVKKANEDARFVLPNACETRIILTMNVRELRHFFSLRMCSRAQWEIRKMAEEMFRLCFETAPALFMNAGPACLRGKCPEGEKSCGQAVSIREERETLINATVKEN